MKKLLSIFLALILVLSFAACTSSEDVKGKVDSKSDALTEKNDDEFKIGLGNSTANTYKNEFIGVSCTLDSDWTFLTQEEIYELNNLTNDMLDEKIAESIESANLIYDMQATTEAGDNVAANIEKLSILNSAIHDEESYIDASLPQLKTSLEDIGITVTKSEKIELEFIGKKTFGCYIVGTASNGVTIYEKLACIKKGSYVYVVAAASSTDGKVDEILNQFKAID